MNAARDIERAIRDILAAKTSLPVGARVVAWQSPSETDGFDQPDAPVWSSNLDRFFPCITVCATPPAASDERAQHAMSCDIAILAATKVADDRDRGTLRTLYEIAEDFATALVFREKPDYTTFEHALSRYDPTILLGGVVRGSPQPPAEDAGIYTLGAAIQIKFYKP